MQKLSVYAALILFVFPLGGAVRFPVGNAAAGPSGLSGELNRMAELHDFELVVHADLSQASAREVSGDLPKRLSLLLADFNHAIIRSSHGRVETVIVLSRKEPAPPAPDEIVLKMQRRGTHHLVQATLVGTDGAETQSQLIIDTGSSFVVLPRSQIATLGIAPDQLSDRQVQTAKGRVRASIGRIPVFRIGGEEITDVETAFIDDAKLGGNALLGMSVLGRYKLILDDETNTLTLILKE